MKLLKNLATLGLITSLLLPNIATASDADDCKAVVKAADKALADQDKVIDLRLKEIKAHSDLEAIQDTQIKNFEKDKNSIFNNPWLYFGLGLVGGVLIVKRVNQ